MTKILLLFGVSSGFAYFTYFSVPILLIAAYQLFAQGQVADFSFKDVANLGGFATFAAVMVWLFTKAEANHRADMAEERRLREKICASIDGNTAATNRLTTSTDRRS